MRNLVCTQSLSIFEDLNVPSCDLQKIQSGMRFPTKLQFEHIYYTYKNNKLIAFKVLAYCVYSHLTTYEKVGLSFLIQMPNERTKWIEDFLQCDTKVFDSVEAFMSHQVNGNGAISLGWDRACSALSEFTTTYVNSTLQYKTLEHKMWKWNNTAMYPTNTFMPYFKRCLFYKDNIYVYLPLKCLGADMFLSKEECIKSRLNGMEIVEFDEDKPTIKINIDITTNKKIHTLRFLEE